MMIAEARIFVALRNCSTSIVSFKKDKFASYLKGTVSLPKADTLHTPCGNARA